MAALTQLASASPHAQVHPLAFADGTPHSGSAKRRSLQAAIEFCLNNGGGGVSVCERGLTQADVDAVHAVGLDVWVWTVNDVLRARELQQFGIDALCTDDPQLVRRGLTCRVGNGVEQ